MKINGTWKSSSGSTLTINENQGEISGTYQLSSDKAKINHKIYGSIDPDETPEVRPLSFSVAWTDEAGKSVHSVTAYTGQFNAKKATPELEVIFLIANDKTPLWNGTGISYDTFTQEVEESVTTVTPAGGAAAATLVGAVTTATVVAAASETVAAATEMTAAAPQQAVSVAGAGERTQAFSDIDIDSSGVIGFPEWYHHFKPLLQETNMEMAELRIMFSAYDADGSKGIDVTEYNSLMNDVFGAVAEGEATTTTESVATTTESIAAATVVGAVTTATVAAGSETVEAATETAAEPVQAVSVAGASERSQAFSDIDIDSSGVIGFPEWYHHFKPLLQETNMEMAELRMMFSAYDADGSKGIDVTEYNSLMNDVFGAVAAGETTAAAPTVVGAVAVATVAAAASETVGTATAAPQQAVSVAGAVERTQSFSDIDIDSSGVIGFPEWYHHFKPLLKETNMEMSELRTMFRVYDADDSKGLDVTEYNSLMNDVFGAVKEGAATAVAPTVVGAVTVATVAAAASETVGTATAAPQQAVSVAGAVERTQSFSDIDIDSSGVIGFPEWYHHFKPLLKETNMEMSELRTMFRVYDADDSKGLDVTEYNSLMNDVFGAVEEGETTTAAAPTVVGAVTVATVAAAASETIGSATAAPQQAVSVGGGAERTQSFSDIDIDSSGVIGFPEWYHHFKPLLKETNMEMSELRTMFRVYDADDSKGLDVNEYTLLMNDVFGVVATDSMKEPATDRAEAFLDIDTDGSSIINFPEWYNYYQSWVKRTTLTGGELLAMFNAYDEAGSTRGIDFAEYSAFMEDVFGPQ